MGNSEILAFLLKKSLEENKVVEKEDTIKNVLTENRMFVFTKFATVPIEIKK